MEKKEKVKGKVNMKDLLAEHQKESPSVAKEEVLNANNFKFDEEYENKLISYNKKLKKGDIGDFYSKLKPRSKILVRVYVNELEKTEGGLLIPNTEIVKAPTQNGVSVLGEMESPFPYSRKAVVVALPEFVKDLKIGQEVLLSNKPVEAVAMGRGDNAMIRIPYGFTHPDLYKRNDLPSDPEDVSYGYLLIPSQEIEIAH